MWRNSPHTLLMECKVVQLQFGDSQKIKHRMIVCLSKFTPPYRPKRKQILCMNVHSSTIQKPKGYFQNYGIYI